jgi:hypothetical protein
MQPTVIRPTITRLDLSDCQLVVCDKNRSRVNRRKQHASQKGMGRKWIGGRRRVSIGEGEGERGEGDGRGEGEDGIPMQGLRFVYDCAAVEALADALLPSGYTVPPAGHERAMGGWQRGLLQKPQQQQQQQQQQQLDLADGMGLELGLELDLSGNHLMLGGDNGRGHNGQSFTRLCKVLALHSSLTSLSLARCGLGKVGDAGIGYGRGRGGKRAAPAYGPKQNYGAEVVVIGGVDINTTGAQAVATAVTGCKSLRSLNLSDNEFDAAAICLIADAVAVNGHLATLDLSLNYVTRGAKRVDYYEYVEGQQTEFTLDGVRALAKMLAPDVERCEIVQAAIQQEAQITLEEEEQEGRLREEEALVAAGKKKKKKRRRRKDRKGTVETEMQEETSSWASRTHLVCCSCAKCVCHSLTELNLSSIGIGHSVQAAEILADALARAPQAPADPVPVPDPLIDDDDEEEADDEEARLAPPKPRKRLVSDVRSALETLKFGGEPCGHRYLHGCADTYAAVGRVGKAVGEHKIVWDRAPDACTIHVNTNVADFAWKGLQSTSLLLLSAFLPRCHSLTTVVLSHNPLDGYYGEKGDWVYESTGVKAFAKAFKALKLCRALEIEGTDLEDKHVLKFQRYMETKDREAFAEAEAKAAEAGEEVAQVEVGSYSY